MFKRIDLASAEYPPLLRQIKKPPESLFVRGELPNHNSPLLAVVGSRLCTPYGRRIAREITQALARAGVVIVSGLAYGIDAIAHEAAVDVGGKTIAVLASGVDRITPANHKPLAERILDHDGAIMSEFPMGTRSFKENFPIRNRIISGMCLGTLVVEATHKSGSIITAKLTLDENRELFAIPGPIDSETSQGTNALLKAGAHLVTSANDVLDVLGLSGAALERPAGEAPTADTKEEAVLLPLLGKQPTHMDHLIRESHLSSATVGTCMTMMELKGKVRHVGGNHYILA